MIDLRTHAIEAILTTATKKHLQRLSSHNSKVRFAVRANGTGLRVRLIPAVISDATYWEVPIESPVQDVRNFEISVHEVVAAIELMGM
jgi:hypothetical protein